MGVRGGRKKQCTRPKTTAIKLKLMIWRISQENECRTKKESHVTIKGINVNGIDLPKHLFRQLSSKLTPFNTKFTYKSTFICDVHINYMWYFIVFLAHFWKKLSSLKDFVCSAALKNFWSRHRRELKFFAFGQCQKAIGAKEVLKS